MGTCRNCASLVPQLEVKCTDCNAANIFAAPHLKHAPPLPCKACAAHICIEFLRVSEPRWWRSILTNAPLPSSCTTSASSTSTRTTSTTRTRAPAPTPQYQHHSTRTTAPQHQHQHTTAPAPAWHYRAFCKPAGDKSSVAISHIEKSSPIAAATSSCSHLPSLFLSFGDEQHF